MRTANPALNAHTFENVQTFGGGAAMTLQGCVNKTFFLLFLVVLAASYVWGQVVPPASSMEGFTEASSRQLNQTFIPLLGIGAFVGFIVGIVTVFKKEWSPLTAPIYSLCQGLVLGAISAIFELSYPGIVIQAIALTFGTLFCLLMAYKSGMIRATENFKLGLAAAMGAVVVLYLVNFIAMLFGHPLHFLYQSGPVGIGISLIIVTIAALNLVLDFDFIEHGSQRGLPKYMEWYAAFGLIMTLIWLYMEILRLLAKLRDNNR